MIVPAQYIKVQCPIPLNKEGMWTWLHDKEFVWYPLDVDTHYDSHAPFFFKESNDAIMFKLMWC